jgi:hypothetical protein
LQTATDRYYACPLVPSGPLLVSFFSIHSQSITMEEQAHDDPSDP